MHSKCKRKRLHKVSFIPDKLSSSLLIPLEILFHFIKQNFEKLGGNLVITMEVLSLVLGKIVLYLNIT